MSLSVATVLVGTFTGINGNGAITLSGAKVGDYVITREGNGTGLQSGGDYEATISVADEIQQQGGANNSSITVTAFLFRPTVSVC